MDFYNGNNLLQRWEIFFYFRAFFTFIPVDVGIEEAQFFAPFRSRLRRWLFRSKFNFFQKYYADACFVFWKINLYDKLIISFRYEFQFFFFYLWDSRKCFLLGKCWPSNFHYFVNWFEEKISCRGGLVLRISALCFFFLSWKSHTLGSISRTFRIRWKWKDFFLTFIASFS